MHAHAYCMHKLAHEPVCMNLQLLPEIALLTVPNFRGYFYTKISLPILYPQKAISKNKKKRESYGNFSAQVGPYF